MVVTTSAHASNRLYLICLQVSRKVSGSRWSQQPLLVMVTSRHGRLLAGGWWQCGCLLGLLRWQGCWVCTPICVTIIDSPDNHALNISPTSMRTCSPPTDGTLILHACIAIICMHIRRYCWCIGQLQNRSIVGKHWCRGHERNFDLHLSALCFQVVALWIPNPSPRRAGRLYKV